MKELAGAGTQNAGLAFGGIDGDFCSCTEEYNGSTWSVGGALSIARTALGGAGTQNAGLAFGGYSPSVSITKCTEEYNGTSWSAGGNLTTARLYHAGAGTQNAALAISGLSLGFTPNAYTEEYTKGVGGSIKTFDYSKETGNITIDGDLTLSSGNALTDAGGVNRLTVGTMVVKLLMVMGR